MLLGERDRAGDEARVQRVEDERGGDDAGQVGGLEPGRVVQVREAAERGQHDAGGGDGDDVLRGVERDPLRRLAADPVSEDRAEREGDGGGRRAVTDEQREREGVGRGDLALGGAQHDLERGELGDDGAGHEEEQQLGARGVEEIETARGDQRDQADDAARHDCGDIACERLAEHRRRVLSQDRRQAAEAGRAGCPEHPSPGTRCVYHLRPCLTVARGG